MRVVNLTGHDVTLIAWNDKQVTLPDDGYIHVYSDTRATEVIEIDGVKIPLLEIIEQPLDAVDEADDTLYVVSGVVAAKAKRPDFVTPARVVRSGGSVVGCRALARIVR